MNEDINLTVFLDSIQKESATEILALKEEIQNENDSLNAEAEQRAIQEASAHARVLKERIESENGLKPAVKAASVQRDLMASREKIAEQVFENVKNRIREYTASDEYIEQLKNLLSKARTVLGPGDATLYLRKEDLAMADELISKDETLRVMEGNFALGGLMLSVGFKRADFSFDTALREQKSHFAEISGLEII